MDNVLTGDDRAAPYLPDAELNSTQSFTDGTVEVASLSVLETLHVSATLVVSEDVGRSISGFVGQEQAGGVDVCLK